MSIGKHGMSIGVYTMPSRTLNVTHEAYDILASHKQAGESFTEVIKRLAGDAPLWDLVGALDEEGARQAQRRMDAGRERARRRRGRQVRS